MSALLCVPLSLGVLAGCKDDTEKGSDAIGYTALSETVVSDAYAANALEKEVEYLLSFDYNKLLYNFRDNANLDKQNATRYGGWESSLIAGHSVGHYMTAVAQAYANGGTSKKQKEDLKWILDGLIDGLKECQDETYVSGRTTGAKEGFLWGANATNKTNVEFQFDNVEANKADIFSQAWVPWYTMHKILAGLIDVYTLTGNKTALEIASNLGDWVYNRVSKWSEATRKTVLSIEYGGMNDCMYNLYALTGKEEHAVAAHKFDEDIPTQGTFASKSMVDRILNEEANYLRGQHANTTIPKIIGLLNGYIRTKGKDIEGVTYDDKRNVTAYVDDYLEVAEKFWERVVNHHSYVTGGNSTDEHFQNDDSQWAIRSNVNCETCNTYNMLKLSRMLFSLTKDKKYLDYYENTYINAILSSQNPETGMTMYFQPMAPGYFKVYSSEFNHFWCCTGSGMESMSKLNDSIYYPAGSSTYVAMYLSSTYKTDKLSLTMSADLENSDTVTIKVDKGSTTLRLRRPDWTKSMSVTVGGKTITSAATDDFVSVEVKEGNTVTVQLEKQITVHNLPDKTNAYAFKYGPYVLSAELGTESMTKTAHGVQVEKAATAVYGKLEYQTTSNSLAEFRRNINTYMTRGNDGKFTLTGIGSDTLTYVLHYKQHTNRYALYFLFRGEDTDVSDTPDFNEDEIEAVIQPGRGQYEGNGYLEDNGSTGSDAVGRYANAGGSFSYWVGVDKSAADKNYIATALAKADNGKTLVMKVGERVLYRKTLNYTGTDEIYNEYIPIPKSVVNEATSNTLNGSTKTRIKVTVTSGKAGEASAALHTYFKTVKLDHYGERDEAVAYFVDCGDYDVTTLSSGDKFGLYNSVTEQVYGADPITGRLWGLVDNHAADIAGPCANGIGTNSTWAFEFLTNGDGEAKTASNRYTKNQTENGVARNLHYKFELPDGTYTVKMYFIDPWGVSKNPNVSANGTSKITNGAVGQELTFSVTVSGGQLTLDITSNSACINLCYIQILFA